MDMIQVAILVIISLFFPPMWFAVAAYIVYLVLTKTSRRNNIIESEIRRLISTGEDSVVLEHLYYESAKSFARDHGASMSRYKNDSADDCLLVELQIDNYKCTVTLQRWTKGGTLLSMLKCENSPVKEIPIKKEEQNEIIQGTSNVKTGLEELEALSVSIYRNYAIKNNIAPTSKTSDQEILYIIKFVSSTFIKIAEHRGEHIKGAHLMTINVHFLHIFETHGKQFFDKHLEYELAKYYKEGLRETYKIDLGLV